MDSGLACDSEFQNASVVWPDSVRPDASVIVPEIMIGTRTLRCSKYCSDREQRGLRVSVSNMVSTIRISAPPSSRPRIASV